MISLGGEQSVTDKRKIYILVSMNKDELNIPPKHLEISNSNNLQEDILQEQQLDVPLGKANPKRHKGLMLLGLLSLAGLVFLGFKAVENKRTETAADVKPKKQANLVKVATVMQKTVPVQLEAIGNVQSGLTVAITPQATGQIIGVHFKKGQEVKKGQLLFTLDSRVQNAAIQQAQSVLLKDQAQIEQARATLAKDKGQIEQAKATLAKDQGQVEQAKATLAKDQAQVEQAKATLAKDEAQAKYAQAQSERYQELYKTGAVTLDQTQQFTANAKSSEATLRSDRQAILNAEAVVQGDKVAISNAQEVVKSDIIAISNAQEVVKGDLAAIQNAQAIKKSDQAALENTKVQSSYTKIYSPIEGRAGNILINQGNVVQANSSNPLVTIARIRPIQVAFSIPEDKLASVQKYITNGKLKVDVAFSGNQNHAQGILTFVNNTVDNSTGTIQLIGDFNNTEGRLFPGQFVNTTLTLTQKPNAIVVPSQAVQNGPNGQFVFVVDTEQMTVENVPVKTSSTIDGGSVIEKGEVKPGAQVVIDGQANLVSGSPIRLRSRPDGAVPPDSSDQKRPRRRAN